MKYLCFYSLWVVFETFFNYKPNLRTEYCCLFKVTTISVMGGIFFFYFSSAISKHWEAELATLKGNNAKLTAALLESTANVKQWKQQLAAYQEEAERLHKRVRAGPLPIRTDGQQAFLLYMRIQHRGLFWRFLLVIKTYVWVVLYVGLLVKKTVFCSFLRMKEFGQLWRPNTQFHIPVAPLVSCLTFGGLFPSFCSVFLSVK